MSSTEKCAEEKVRWKYSAPFEPFSYWETLGHGYEYCEAMEEFQKQFTEAVNEMRRRKKGADVIFNYPLFDHSRTSDTIIFHDEALLPHWREVALACKFSVLRCLLKYIFHRCILLPISAANIQLIMCSRPCSPHNKSTTQWK